MQQTTNVLAQAGAAQPAADALIGERIEEIAHSVKQWLDSRSGWASRVVEQPITNRQVLRIWAVAACLLLVAFSIATSPVTAIASGAAMAWLVYRVNQEEPKQPFSKKGGRV